MSKMTDSLSKYFSIRDNHCSRFATTGLAGAGVYVRYHCCFLLLYHSLIVRLFLVLILMIINFTLTESSISYCMDEDPTDPVRNAMNQRKIDNDLLVEISDQAMESRIHAIVAGPNAAAFQQDLLAIANGNIEIGALNEAIDNVDGNASVRDRIRGYESIIIFVAATVLAYVIINHWRDVFSFIGGGAQNTLTALEYATMGQRAIEMYHNPATHDQVVAIVNHYYNLRAS
jgi:hypothetical protein